MPGKILISKLRVCSLFFVVVVVSSVSKGKCWEGWKKRREVIEERAGWNVCGGGVHWASHGLWK